jgi:alkylation response protein AidB-like acyl-CoA dehydrogenase
MERLYSETQTMVRDSVRKFAQTEVFPAAGIIDATDEFPTEIYCQMADMGLFGTDLAEEDGGSGFDTVTMAIAMEEIATASGSVGNALALPVEAARFLMEHGDEGHKVHVPGILFGDTLPATAISEPDFGSDVAGIRSTALREGDDYVINGSKAWVTMGLVADLFVVLAKTDRDKGIRGISCFLVHGDNPGLERGRKEKLLGMHGLATCQINFTDCRIPATDRIGAEGEGFKMMMGNFNYGRIMMSAMSLGIARAAYEDALAYARTRTQFGQPIFDFQAIQFMLADMSKDIEAARLLIHHAARLLDQGHSMAKEAAHAKLFTTDMAMLHVTNALQIHGGNGYSQEYRIERLFRDIKLPQIYEGTNQIQRLIIARQIARD